MGEKRSPYFTDVKTEVTYQKGNTLCPRSASKETGLSLKPKAVQSQSMWVFQVNTPISPREAHSQGKENKQTAWRRDRGEAVWCPNVGQVQLGKTYSLRAREWRALEHREVQAHSLRSEAACK